MHARKEASQSKRKQAQEFAFRSRRKNKAHEEVSTSVNEKKEVSIIKVDEKEEEEETTKVNKEEDKETTKVNANEEETKKVNKEEDKETTKVNENEEETTKVDKENEETRINLSSRQFLRSFVREVKEQASTAVMNAAANELLNVLGSQWLIIPLTKVTIKYGKMTTPPNILEAEFDLL